MPIGSSLGITLPTVGQAAWGGPLNTILQSIIDAVESSVSVGAVVVNSPLDMSGLGTTSTGYVRFVGQAATLSGGSHTLKLFTYNGELYFTDGGGTAIQITSGGAVIASGSGGITGSGYGTGGVELTWDGTYYAFKDGAGANDYAPIAVDDIRLSDGSTNFITLEAAAGMSADYSVVFPNALPGSTSLVQISSAGVLSYSNTMPASVTLSSTVTVSGTINCTQFNYSTARTHYFSTLGYNAALAADLSYTDWTINSTDGELQALGTNQDALFTFSGVPGEVDSVTFKYLTNGSGTFTLTLYVYAYGVSAGNLISSANTSTHKTGTPGSLTVSGLSHYPGNLIFRVNFTRNSGLPYGYLGGVDTGNPYMSITWPSDWT